MLPSRGAWIEIHPHMFHIPVQGMMLPSRGAWIEIPRATRFAISAR